MSGAEIFAENMRDRVEELGTTMECCLLDCDGFWLMMIFEYPATATASRWMKSYADLTEAADDLESLSIFPPEVTNRMRTNPHPTAGERVFTGRIRNPKETLRSFHFFPCSMCA